MFNARDLLAQIMQAAMIGRTAGMPEVAVELHAAPLLAIEVDTPAAREYRRRLAPSVKLAPAAVRRAYRALDAPAAA